jgi:hypothetical protein
MGYWLSSSRICPRRLAWALAILAAMLGLAVVVAQWGRRSPS